MIHGTKTTKTTTASSNYGLDEGSIAVGRSIGPYQVVQFLGRGGMGEVYEVLSASPPRRFALKVIGTDLAADEKARELFRREGHEAGKLDHPNIVRVDECGEFEGRLYLRMELIEGRDCGEAKCSTLADYIIANERRVPSEKAIPIVHDILRGLAYAHARRRVHRDIKPSNILMSPGAAKIGDFGLVMAGARNGGSMTQMSEVVVVGYGAQSVLSATQFTGPSSAAGTPDYMAPELLSGDVEANYSTDVYSVGILLLEMLTGTRRAGTAKPSQLLQKHRKLDPWWDELYAGATAYHEDRIGNAGQMLALFERMARVGPPADVTTKRAEASASEPETLQTKQPRAGPLSAGVAEHSGEARNALRPDQTTSGPAAEPTVAPNQNRAESTSVSPDSEKRVIVSRSHAWGRARWVPVTIGGLVAAGGVISFAMKDRHPMDQRQKQLILPLVGSSNALGATEHKRAASANAAVALAPSESGKVSPSNEKADPKLVAEDGIQVKRTQEAIVRITQLIEAGQVEEAWKCYNTNLSSVHGGDPRLAPLAEEVKEKSKILEKLKRALEEDHVSNMRDLLSTWNQLRPVRSKGPEIIGRAIEKVREAETTSEETMKFRKEFQDAVKAKNLDKIVQLTREKAFAKEANQVAFTRERDSIIKEVINDRTTALRDALKQDNVAVIQSKQNALTELRRKVGQPNDDALRSEVEDRISHLQDVQSVAERLRNYKPTEQGPAKPADKLLREPRVKAAYDAAYTLYYEAHQKRIEAVVARLNAYVGSEIAPAPPEADLDGDPKVKLAYERAKQRFKDAKTDQTAVARPSPATKLESPPVAQATTSSNPIPIPTPATIEPRGAPAAPIAKPSDRENLLRECETYIKEITGKRTRPIGWPAIKRDLILKLEPWKSKGDKELSDFYNKFSNS